MAPESAVIASDARRERMRELRDKVVVHVRSGETREAIKWHMKILDLIAEEEMLGPLGEHYEILARLFGAVGDKENAVKWVEMAIEDLELYGGVEEYDQIPELEAFLRGSRK
ncbi:uncharacterized protein DNG_06693 [Cephalotrichum gorgonifer]|uniref:Uncharacterized protein n=1 Tax=Cephalotrichum gorgonifer TaxID=2041049 RepID=A0AAE8N0D1_9PEZI|nr:uncharacterized protein DNG_06693 [Cephalotrichum gorgonifer]